MGNCHLELKKYPPLLEKKPVGIRENEINAHGACSNKLGGEHPDLCERLFLHPGLTA